MIYTCIYIFGPELFVAYFFVELLHDIIFSLPLRLDNPCSSTNRRTDRLKRTLTEWNLTELRTTWTPDDNAMFPWQSWGRFSSSLEWSPGSTPCWSPILRWRANCRWRRPIWWGSSFISPIWSWLFPRRWCSMRSVINGASAMGLSLIHIWRCRRRG